MAGHSQFKNIMYRKGAQDAKRSKIFTKLIREIVTAARLAGGDPDANPRLRLVLDKARSANMPKDTIERAIQRGDRFLQTDMGGAVPGRRVLDAPLRVDEVDDLVRPFAAPN